MNRASVLSDLAQANSISRKCGWSHGLEATSRQPMTKRGGSDRLTVAYEALRDASIIGALYWYTLFMASCFAYIIIYLHTRKKSPRNFVCFYLYLLICVNYELWSIVNSHFNTLNVLLCMFKNTVIHVSYKCKKKKNHKMNPEYLVQSLRKWTLHRYFRSFISAIKNTIHQKTEDRA